METKLTKWLLAAIALALLLNAAVSFRPYQLVVVVVPPTGSSEATTESYRLNVYTGKVSTVVYDEEESVKFYPRELKDQFPKR